jgi:integrase
MAAIEKRGENSYRLIVSCGYNKENKKIVKKKTINLDPKLTERQKEKELQRQLVMFQNEVEQGTYLDGSKMTLEKFSEKWLADHVEKQLEPKTIYSYKELLNTRIIPALGHLKLDKIQPTHLLEFYNNLSENGMRLDGKKGGLSSRTILYYHRLLSSMFTTAVHWQLIMNNPCARVKAPKIERTEAKHYDEEQTETMLALLENEPIKYRTMINLVVFTGMRLGELVGLTWDDIELDSPNNACVRIRQAGQYLPGVGSFDKTTKTKSSQRLVSLPALVVNLLKEYKTWQDAEKLALDNIWEEHNRVFTQQNGKPMFHSTPSHWFKKFIKRNNLSEITFHQLRHTNATLLIDQGVDVRTVANRLGHAQTSTTINIYSCVK